MTPPPPHSERSQTNGLIQTAAFTFTSSFVASTLTYPLEVRKTIIQQSESSVRKSSIMFCKRSVDERKNWRRASFARVFVQKHYAGYGAHALCYPTFWSTYFFTTECIRRIDKSPDARTWQHSCATALVSSLAGSTVSNPFFVVKTRMQTAAYGNGGLAGVSFLQVARGIYYSNSSFAKKSVKPFAAGWFATQITNSKLILQMPLYELIVGRNKDSVASATTIATAATASKIATSTLFYPLDLVRTRQRNGDARSVGAIFAEIVHASSNKPGHHFFGGLRSMYCGISLYLAATIPNFVLMMFAKDFLFKRWSSGSGSVAQVSSTK